MWIVEFLHLYFSSIHSLSQIYLSLRGFKRTGLSIFHKNFVGEFENTKFCRFVVENDNMNVVEI